MLAKSQNEKHISNGYLQVPHQLTRILTGLRHTHVITPLTLPLPLHIYIIFGGGLQVGGRKPGCGALATTVTGKQYISGL
jgi:hypothetical protein